MKILIIAPQPFFTIRGTPLAIKELAAVFTKLGHRVDILTFHLGEDIALPKLKIYRTRLFSRFIRSIPPGFSIRKLILDMVILPKALFMILTGDYDIVHCIEESAFFISRFRWIKNSLFTYDMDSNIPRQLFDSGKIKNKFLISLAEKMEVCAINGADAVITICSSYTNRIKKQFPKKQVFQVEDVSVSDEIYPVEDINRRRRILYTGNFEKYQGVDILLEGFYRIKNNWPEVDLVIVGGEKEEVEILRKKYNCVQIIFMGKRPYSEMKGYLRLSDIFVSPRLCGENTPFKIYSYMAAGRPILATDILSHSQVLTDGKNALLVEPTVEGISLGLDRLLRDETFAGKIGIGAKELFKQKYTRRCFEEKIEEYLQYMEDERLKKFPLAGRERESMKGSNKWKT